MFEREVGEVEATMRAAYPALHGAVEPWFANLAERALARAGGIEPLHTQRLSLFTAVHGSDWSPTLAPILRAVDGQLGLVATVPGVAGLHRRLAQIGEAGPFLSAMSELALACHLLSAGASLTFDHPFEVLDPYGKVAAENDADLLASWPTATMAVDVYSPVHDSLGDEFCGWFVPTLDGFADVVEKKAVRKFGGSRQARRGLPADAAVVLAVDVTYHHDAARVLFLRPGGLRAEMLASRLTPGIVDGVLVYRHAQGSPGHPVQVLGMLRLTDRLDPVDALLRRTSP